METPAHTPDSTISSETVQDTAVQPAPASTTEVVDGNQSLPEEKDFMDPDNWEAQLAALQAQEEAAKNGQAAQSGEPAVPEATAPTETTPEAGAAAEVEATEAGDEKYGPQHRIRPRSETDAAVLKLMSRNQDMTLEEAISKVKGSSPTAPEAQAADVAPAVAAASALEALNTEWDQKKQELKAAQEDFDHEKAAQLQGEIFELMEKRMEAKAAKAQADVAQSQAWDAKVAQYEADTVRLYPAAAAPNSQLNITMQAIYATMQATDDPTLYRPDMQLKLAQMAAAQLNIAPVVNTPAPVATPSQAAAPQRPLAKVSPAAGGQIGGAVTIPGPDAALQGSENWTPEQWETFTARTFGSR